MATVTGEIFKLYDKSDKTYKTGLARGMCEMASTVTQAAISSINASAGSTAPQYVINLGGIFGRNATIEATSDFLDRRYNIRQDNVTISASPLGNYYNGFAKQWLYYNTTSEYSQRSYNLLEQFTTPPNKQNFLNSTNGYTNDYIINFHTMGLEEYLSKAPFSTSNSFVHDIVLKRNPVGPTDLKKSICGVESFVSETREDFISKCKAAWGECKVIVGYDIIDYNTKEIIQTIDGTKPQNQIATSKTLIDKCSYISVSGWTGARNVNLKNAVEVTPPVESGGFQRSDYWDQWLFYSELVFPLSCNATVLAAASSSGYQHFNAFFSLVHAVSKTAYENLGYGHYFYTFQNESDFSTYIDSDFGLGNLRGYGVLGVWNDEQIKTYAEKCLGMAYTIDDLFGEPENPPDDGQPTNPDDDDPGDGDNRDDPVPINPEYDPGFASVTAWTLSGDEVTELNNWFFGGYLDGIKEKFTGSSPFDMLMGLYKYNIHLQSLYNIATDTKKFQCAGVEKNDDTLYRYIKSASGMISLNDGFYVNRYYGNFLDYEPYTTMKLYIPYCGIMNLPCNLVYGNTLTINLAVDWFSGECTAFVMANDGEKSFLIDSIKGQLGMQKIFCGRDDSPMIRGLTKTLSKTAIALLSKGIGAAATAGFGPAVGGVVQSVLGSQSQNTGGIAGITNQLLDNISTPPKIDINGECSESLSAYAPQDCIIYIERTIPALPGNSRNDFTTLYNYIGRPASYEATVGSFSGFLSCSEIKGTLNNAIITEEEKNMIYSALRGGIYING